MRRVLRGATVIDGTGAARRSADVAVEGDRIVDVAEAIRPDQNDEVVDLDGLVLAPGFIDPHTHYDAQILWDSDLTPSCWHGVTTVVMGNCGFSIAPTRPEHRSKVCRTLENVEGMSVEALETGIRWDFETFTEWLACIRQTPKRLNVASMIGHTPLRLYVLGDEALQRPATPAEADAMRSMVVEALRAGAIGFATSRSPNHQGDGGEPVPSRQADWQEVRHIASALQEVGRGIVQVTPGPGLFMRELSELSQLIDRPVTWTGVLTRGGVPWPVWDPDSQGSPTELVDRQAAFGGNVWPQISCRELVMQVVLSDPFPFAMLPAMNELLALPHDQRAMLYADQSWRDRARPQMDSYWGHRWSVTTIEETERFAELRGRDVAQLAVERGVHPFDLMIDLALEEELTTRFRIVIANADRDEVGVLLTDKRTLLALSDAGAHASQLSDACYSTHLLGYWVRERETLSLEDAIWRLSGQVAEVFEIPDRGRVAPGFAADLVAFDPATVGPGDLSRVHDLPAGADRLVSRSTGIDRVWVNGVAILEHGEDVDLGPARPGRLVTGRMG